MLLYVLMLDLYGHLNLCGCWCETYGHHNLCSYWCQLNCGHLKLYVWHVDDDTLMLYICVLVEKHYRIRYMMFVHTIIMNELLYEIVHKWGPSVDNYSIGVNGKTWWLQRHGNIFPLGRIKFVSVERRWENNIFLSGWCPRENKHFPVKQTLYFWWLEIDSKNNFLSVHHIFLSTSDGKDRILDLMANNFPVDNVSTKNWYTDKKIRPPTRILYFFLQTVSTKRVDNVAASLKK